MPSVENVFMVSLLSVSPSFCITETTYNLFPVQILGKIIKNFSNLNVFPIYVIVIFNLDR